VKLAVVVQRYGQAISGGAELHARYIAEHLARHAEVEVLTTHASDYVTWRNEPGPVQERINGIPVRRFPVEHERDLLAFSRALSKERQRHVREQLTEQELTMFDLRTQRRGSVRMPSLTPSSASQSSRTALLITGSLVAGMAAAGFFWVTAKAQMNDA